MVYIYNPSKKLTEQMITPLIQKTVVTITFLGFLLGVVAVHFHHIPPYISLVVFAATAFVGF